MNRQLESSLTPSRQFLAPEVRFYAGEWEELPTVLSVVRTEDSKISLDPRLHFSEEDIQSDTDHSTSSRQRSRKPSGSQAWERGSDVADSDDVGGYDVIMINEIPSSSSALRRLYALIKQVSHLEYIEPPSLVVILKFLHDPSSVDIYYL